MDDVRAEVPKVVLRRTGVKDDLRCVESTVRWELRVVRVWTIVMEKVEWDYNGVVGESQ
jgi:hypothetical protein